VLDILGTAVLQHREVFLFKIRDGFVVLISDYDVERDKLYPYPDGTRRRGSALLWILFGEKHKCKANDRSRE
jgi:hypothetical protein